MRIPDDYTDALVDELAPYGFEFRSATEEDDGEAAVLFEADPESFVRVHPELGIAESYGVEWPPPTLELWLRFDRNGDPEQIDFEVFDLLAWAASEAPDLQARLNSMADPADHAVAVGEALGRVMEQERSQVENYLDYSG